MTPQNKPIGIPGAESLARARQVTHDVITELERDPPWRTSIERVSVRSAVDRCVTGLIQSGETNDATLKAEALRAIAGKSPTDGARGHETPSKSRPPA